MGIEKFLSKKEIKKTIDPGSGDTASPKRSISTEQRESVQKPPTPASNLIDDIKSQAKIVINKVENTVKEIYDSNKSEPIFTDYYNVVSKERSQRLEALSGGVYYPPSNTQIKSLERDVFRLMVDPRTPFIRDLYRIGDEVNGILSVMDGFWTRLTKPNKLYSNYKANRVVQYSLLREKQYVDLLGTHVDDIKGNKLELLSDCFVRGMSRIFVGNSISNLTIETLDQTENVINLLDTIRSTLLVLQTSQFTITEHWELFQENIGKSFGNLISYIGQQAINQASYVFFGGIEEQIFNLSGLVQVGIDISAIDGGPCLDMIEFKNQIDGSLYKQLAKIESHLIQRESLAKTLDENRAAAILASQKNSKLNQYIKFLDTLIHELELIKTQSIVLNNKYIANLTDKLTSKVTNYGKFIRVGSPKK